MRTDDSAETEDEKQPPLRLENGEKVMPGKDAPAVHDGAAGASVRL